VVVVVSAECEGCSCGYATSGVYSLKNRFLYVELKTVGWTVEGSNPGGGQIFRTRPDRN
jgi:hypothetical protein